MPGAPVSGARQRPATSRARLRQARFSRSNAAELPPQRNGFAAGSGRNMPTSHRPGTPHQFARCAPPGTSFPARRGKTPSSRVAPHRNIFPGAKPKNRRRKHGASASLAFFPASATEKGARRRADRPFRRSLSVKHSSNTGRAPKKRAAAISFRSFRPSPTPQREGSSWSPRAARWSGPAPCRRSSRAPPGRCPDG